MRHLIQLCAAAAVVATVAVLPVRADELPERIKLGHLFTKSGPGADFQISFGLAVRLAIKEIQESGGIAGRPVDLVEADDHADPTQAVTETRRLVQSEKVAAQLGPYNTQFNLAIAPFLTQARIASMVVSSSAAFTPQVSPYGFSAYLPSRAYYNVILDYAADVLKSKRIALITDSGAASKQAREDIKAYLAERGQTLVATEEHDLGATEVMAQLLRLRRAEPDLLIESHSIGADTGYIVKGLDELGWDPIMIGNTLGTTAGAVMKVAGNDIYTRGNRLGNTLKAFTYCPGETSATSGVPALMERLKAFAPSAFAQLNSNIVPAVYDGVFVLKAAIEATKSLDGATIAAWIEENGKSVKTITGTVSADKHNHFIFGPDSVTITARPDLKRADGMMPRVQCP